MKSDYVVTVRIKQHPHISQKLMKQRIEHYLNYWFHNDAELDVLRVVRKKVS